MRTGRLKIIQLAKLSINDFIEKSQEQSKCMICEYEFRIGDNLLNHCMENHKDWVEYKLLENMAWQQEHAAILKPFNPFGDDEEEIGEPNSLEYQDQCVQAPRCKNCNHNDPDYIVASSPPHKDGIKLKCVWCGDISVKD